MHVSLKNSCTNPNLPYTFDKATLLYYTPRLTNCSCDQFVGELTRSKRLQSPPLTTASLPLRIVSAVFVVSLQNYEKPATQINRNIQYGK